MHDKIIQITFTLYLYVVHDINRYSVFKMQLPLLKALISFKNICLVQFFNQQLVWVVFWLPYHFFNQQFVVVISVNRNYILDIYSITCIDRWKRPGHLVACICKFFNVFHFKHPFVRLFIAAIFEAPIFKGNSIVSWNYSNNLYIILIYCTRHE